MNCGVEDCSGTHYARGWCKYHYNRNLRTGDPEGKTRRPVTYAQCHPERRSHSRGLCRRCFDLQRTLCFQVVQEVQSGAMTLEQACSALDIPYPLAVRWVKRNVEEDDE